MDAANVILVALATWQIVEILHHSEIALPIRRLAARNTQTGVFRSFFSRAYNCPFCLTHWVAATLIAVLLFYPAHEQCRGLLTFVLVVFATARLANLGNDLAYNYTRTPRIELEEHSEDIEIEDKPPEDDGDDLRG